MKTDDWMVEAIIGAAIGTPVLLIGILFFGSIPANTVRLHDVARKFETIQHPEQSHFLIHLKQVGGYFTNNGCDYDVGEFRTSALNREELRAWYESLYPDYFATPGANPSLSIDFLDEEWCTQDMSALCFNWIQKSSISRMATNQQRTYLIVLTNVSRGNFLDFRCVY